MREGTILIRRAFKDDALVIARLHKKLLPEGFLSSINERFLVLLYRNLICSKNSFCFVANEGYNISGFIVGVTSISRFHKEFLKNNFLSLVQVFLVSIFRPAFIRKVAEDFLYPVTLDKRDYPDAELFSIAIDTDCQGKGIGKALFSRLVEEFQSLRIDYFKVLVSKHNTKARIFYEKMGGVIRSEIQMHRGECSVIYVFMDKGNKVSF